jgi:hypothetical protein
MSRASKVTFITCCLFTTSTIGIVFYLKDLDLETRRVGIHRDINQRRLQNDLEHQQQLLLHSQLSSVGSSSGGSTSSVGNN